MFLRQSTASQEVLLGPFVDSTDGNTAETGLTIANTDIKVWKSGGTTEASKNSGGATHIASGRYYAVLDATDTDTVGLIELNVHVAGALPVRRQFYVLAAAAYDAMFGSSPTDIAAILADTNELQTDLTNGGRLDLLIDVIELWTKRNAVLLTGLLSGAGTNTEVYTISALGITATCTTDPSGNRSAVVWS